MDKKGISKKKLVSELTRLRKRIAELQKVKVKREKTERGKKQEQILLVNERLKYLLTATSVVVYASKTSGDYGATFISDNVRQMTGYGSTNFVKKASFWFDNIHPEDHKHVLKEVKKLFKKDYHVHEYRFRRKDGEYIWVRDEMRLVRDEKGKPVEITGFWTDITECKEIEDKLQRSSELLKKFMESATEGFVLFDSNMNIVDINDYLIKEFGFKKENMIGLNILDITLNPWESGRYNQYIKVIETGKPYIIDDVMPPPEFGDKHFALKAFKVGDGMGMIIRDVTDQIKAEKALQESEARFRSLYESVQAGVIVQDASGKIIHANKIACDILGISASRLKEKKLTGPFWRMIDENGMRVSDEEHPLIMTFRTGRLVRNAVRGVFADDPTKMRWLLINTESLLDPLTRKPEEVIFTFVDITERKQAEEGLQESEMRYRHIFEHSPVGIGVSSLEGKVITANKAMLTITGYSLKELRKINIADTYMNEKDRKYLLEALKRYGSITDYRVRLKRKDGTPYDALLSISRVNIGGKDYFHTICQDITGKKKPKRRK
jgi:PAS domain S-box-containing protein